MITASLESCVDTEFKRRMYVTDTDHNRYAFRGEARCRPRNEAGWKLRSRRMWRNPSMREGSAAVAEKRDIERKKGDGNGNEGEVPLRNRSVTGSTARRYAGMEGMEIVDIPKLKLPRPRFRYRGRFGGQAPDSRLLAREPTNSGRKYPLDGHAEREEERRKRRKRRFPAGATGTCAGTPGTEQGERRALIAARAGYSARAAIRVCESPR